ncbi:UDP-N-acetylglucosamine 2-epimerase, partial [Listeria monocytogenes]
TDEETIYNMAKQLLVDQKEYDNMSKASNPYGDGQASKRIVEELLHRFGLSEEKPVPFQS